MVKKFCEPGCWWLTLVILATWEAEIRKTSVDGQPRQKSLQDPIPMGGKKKLHMVAHTYHPSYGGKCKIVGSLSRLAWAKSKTISPK
jgi:hypothetical protein